MEVGKEGRLDGMEEGGKEGRRKWKKGRKESSSAPPSFSTSLTLLSTLATGPRWDVSLSSHLSTDELQPRADLCCATKCVCVCVRVTTVGSYLTAKRLKALKHCLRCVH